MKELSIIKIFGSALSAVLGSKVLILIILILMMLFVNIIFSNLMNKKLVNIITLIASFILVGFYSVSYIETIKVFIDNVSTKLLEMIYFPTTLEFMIVMILSFAIMISSLVSKKSSKNIKIINTTITLIISFLFLCIIEKVNGSNIDFNEFSVFSDTTLMSLHELAMGLFIAWIIGLGLYKFDSFIINKATNEVKNVEYKYNTINTLSIDEINSQYESEEIEMPKLKEL